MRAPSVGRGASRIGLGIGETGLRAVGVGQRRVLWAIEAELEASDALAPALVALLARAPLVRWPRPQVVAAIGPSRAQTKRLAGLPPTADPRVVERLVAENAGRFFLRNGVPLVTSSVVRDDDGHAWTTAFEQPVVRAVEEACRALRLRLVGVVPTAAVLAAGTVARDTASTIRWRDGKARVDVEVLDGRLVGARRSFDHPEDPDRSGAMEPISPGLARLGDASWRFADAYGAALTDSRQGTWLRPVGATDAHQAAHRRAAAGAALALACILALIAPAMRARHVERDARARLAALAGVRREATLAERTLAQVTGALDEVSRFDPARHSTVLLLAELTSALPDGVALVALRTDSAGGTLVLLAPRASAALSRLERVPSIVSPQVVGPVTRESVGGRDLDRLTVRFRRGAAPARHARESR